MYTYGAREKVELTVLENGMVFTRDLGVGTMEDFSQSVQAFALREIGIGDLMRVRLPQLLWIICIII